MPPIAQCIAVCTSPFCRCSCMFMSCDTVYVLWIMHPHSRVRAAECAGIMHCYTHSGLARCKCAASFCVLPYCHHFSLPAPFALLHTKKRLRSGGAFPSFCFCRECAAAPFLRLLHSPPRTRSSRHSSTTSTFSRPKVSKMFLSASSAAGAGFLISDSIASSTVMGLPAACVSAASICLSCPPLSMTLR